MNHGDWEGEGIWGVGVEGQWTRMQGQETMLVKNMRKKAKRKGLQHLHFPRGPPPQYYTGHTMFDFMVRMGHGIFIVVWPQAKATGVTRLLKGSAQGR